MSIARACRWLLVGSVLVANPLLGGPQDPPPCRSYLVPCNIGDAYSGTVQWVSTLESPEGKTTTTEKVTVNVVRGKARCEGSIVNTDPSAGTGLIKGDGLLVVEWGTGVEDDPKLPWYRVAVACPGVGGSSPARMNGSEMDTYKQPRRSGFSRLEGKHEEENPDADPANGVTGTVRLSWSLSRE